MGNEGLSENRDQGIRTGVRVLSQHDENLPSALGEVDSMVEQPSVLDGAEGVHPQGQRIRARMPDRPDRATALLVVGRLGRAVDSSFVDAGVLISGSGWNVRR